ncbi:DUF427 domain-containing protein [Paenibacillus qinlingensis]|uniref:DUF427 domain-containing protein n=1 Tax=Paenibacillus qinlingensis TaxID=1837343 RepID=UPI001565C51C|nr:DUF427 domain-containing protein [Paenibacillus qinlingensis]NQX59690.1 DUF427 domain-containing protein [Paenibacillus qinlingensis]
MSHVDPQWSLRDGNRTGWQIRAEVSPRWIRVIFRGVTVADSKQVLVVTETGKLPVYYFPRSDVRTELLTVAVHSEEHVNKGKAAYWDIQIGDQTIERAAWSYSDPSSESSFLKDYVSFVWKKADAWFEEEEEIFVHARDPYSRIDAIQSSRHIQVIVGGEVVADSHRPVILYETGLTPRYYLPKEEIRLELFTASDSVTRCPYKGIASYWSATLGGRTFKDVAWSYAEALPEVHEIAGLLSFYNEEVDALLVDGKKWSLEENDRLPYKQIAPQL